MSRGRYRVNSVLTMRCYAAGDDGKRDWGRAMSAWAMLWRSLLALFGLSLAQAAGAQTTTTYTNSTTGTINNGTTCTAPLVRNFTVGTSYTVADVDIGVFATHSWRGDLRITLQAPDGTRVQIVNGDTTNTINGDNFNVLLNDGGTQLVNSDRATGNHSATTPPPFQNNFIPNAVLSAFAGKNSQGTWRLEICDVYPQADNGTFSYAALYLTSAPAAHADLSLSKTVSSATPAAGANITYTLSVTNASGSPSTASGVAVTDVLPAGTSFVSASGFGSYNSATGVWTVGSIAPGQTRSITLTVNVTAMASASVTNTAEVTASSVIDLDSTPNNGSVVEDDQASASFTVAGTRVAGSPPALSCPAGTTIFDWDLITWAAGSLTNAYAVSGIGTVNFAITSSATWVNNAGFGGQSPTNNNSAITGGLSPAQFALHQYLDFNTRSETADTVITLPTTVPGAQFSLFDIDFNAGQFADKLVITGSYQGATVFPTLTNGISNYTVGNTAVGDTGASNTAAEGTVVVTFSQPIDTITIRYGNHTTAPANPGGQAMALHDITFCRPVAVLGVTKISTLISDPTNGTTNPRMIPGAVVEYCILLTNPGSGTATNIVGTDTIPATLTYSVGSMLSGSSCGAASTAEDDDAAGADESDPYGASIAGNILTATAATMVPNASFALKFRTTIK